MKKTNINLFKIKNKQCQDIQDKFALVERIKRKGSLLYQLFPINHRTKYPIFFDKLLERINSLKIKYNRPCSINVYLPKGNCWFK
jgi:hypothetical protein